MPIFKKSKAQINDNTESLVPIIFQNSPIQDDSKKEDILNLIELKFWDKIRDKPDVYLPNLNDSVNDNSLEIELKEYSVELSSIKGKVKITKEYWTNDDKLEKMESKCKFAYNREIKKFDVFNMSLVKEAQI
jgi:hypothetical protein